MMLTAPLMPLLYGLVLFKRRFLRVNTAGMEEGKCGAERKDVLSSGRECGCGLGLGRGDNSGREGEQRQMWR